MSDVQQPSTISDNTSTGILLIDKPSGWTSHDVVAKLRGITKIKRIGHAGTLDPLATGLLIVLVGRAATKLQDRFLKQDKVYLCEATFGFVTNTYDSDGEVVQQTEWAVLQGLTQAKLDSIIPQFQGSISQQVPLFSAVKVAGRPLYRHGRTEAKTGQPAEVERPTRTVMIHKLQILDFQKDELNQTIKAQLEVTCSSGTYIRSLVHDIGQALGVGAVVSALRRTRSGEFMIDQAHTLNFVQEKGLSAAMIQVAPVG